MAQQACLLRTGGPSDAHSAYLERLAQHVELPYQLQVGFTTVLKFASSFRKQAVIKII